MSDLEAEPNEDHTATPEWLTGEYRDSASYNLLAAAIVIPGLLLAIDVGAGAFRNPFLAVFSLLFPAIGLLLAYYALTVAVLGFDRSGWHYRRQIFGHVRETEQGRWSDIAQTSFRQWAEQGRYATAMYGELSLLDSSGRTVLKAKTCFYTTGGNPGAGHAPGKRQIGLSKGDFRRFVRLINDETPQLGYVWVEDVEHEGPPKNRFFYADPGPDWYVASPRGERPSDSINLPTPF